MPALSTEECRSRLEAVPHAYLATADAVGVPHVVPVVHALVGGAVVHAVDHKPKRSRALRRLANIAANPSVGFLADHYEADWSRLWWVRADAQARLVTSGPEFDAAIEALVARHPQYAARPPAGPAVIAEVTRWSGWVATA